MFCMDTLFLNKHFYSMIVESADTRPQTKDSQLSRQQVNKFKYIFLTPNVISALLQDPRSYPGFQILYLYPAQFNLTCSPLKAGEVFISPNPKSCPQEKTCHLPITKKCALKLNSFVNTMKNSGDYHTDQRLFK